jgi:hypothetical protein
MATSKISERCVFICLLGLTSVIHVSNSGIAGKLEGFGGANVTPSALHL